MTTEEIEEIAEDNEPSPKVVITLYDEKGEVIESGEEKVYGPTTDDVIQAVFDCLETNFMAVRDIPAFKLRFVDCKGKERRAYREAAKRVEYEKLKEAELRRQPEFIRLRDAAEAAMKGDIDPDNPAYKEFHAYYDKTLKALYVADPYKA